MRLLRSRRRTQPVDPLGAGVDQEAPERLRLDDEVLDHLDHAERHELLLQAFAELSEQHRTLLLVLVQDPPPSYLEVSARLGIPVGSIGPTRARALQRIREHPAVAAWIAASSATEGSRS
jgi:DNA-directed RNA polymerase specialized sigma24 family protein